MLNSAQCQWMSTDVSDDDDETASAATEMSDLESVTETSVRSSCYETEEDGPADIVKPMVENGAGCPKGLSHFDKPPVITCIKPGITTRTIYAIQGRISAGK